MLAEFGCGLLEMLAARLEAGLRISNFFAFQAADPWLGMARRLLTQLLPFSMLWAGHADVTSPLSAL